jgi:hypothetical protein
MVVLVEVQAAGTAMDLGDNRIKELLSANQHRAKAR